MLWDYIPSKTNKFKALPKLTDPRELGETEDSVGAYTFGRRVGEGQFATVRIFCGVFWSAENFLRAISTVISVSVSANVSFT